MTTDLQTQAFRRGLTVIEIVAAVAILSVLVAILAPAVLSTREAARGISCLNNLRQIGLASQNYVSTHQAFPSGGLFHLAMLPYVDQLAAYEELVDDFGGPSAVYKDADLVRVFACPSDVGTWERGVKVNYFLCGGVAGGWDRASGVPNVAVSWDGFRYDPRGYTDGLSNTVLLNEAVSQPLRYEEAAERPERYGGWNSGHVIDPIEFPKLFVLEVQRAPVRREAFSPMLVWDSISDITDFIGHALPPNSRSGGNTSEGPADLPWRNFGSYAASSEHPASVNVLMADGAAKNVSESIDLHAWRRIGTSVGND